MKIKDVANSAWTGVTNLAGKAGKLPKRYLLPAMLVTGMTVGGGSVALAQNNKDSFKKTELLAQNNTKKSTFQQSNRFDTEEFTQWIAHVIRERKNTPLDQIEPFLLNEKHEFVIANKVYLSYSNDSEKVSKMLSGEDVGLSKSEYAREGLDVLKALGQPNGKEVLNALIQNDNFIKEFNNVDYLNKNGVANLSELAIKFRYLDLLDGKKDKKITARSIVESDYNPAKLKEAARSIAEDVKSGVIKAD